MPQAGVGKGGRIARQMARRLGYDLVRADFYSPIPDVDSLPERLWTTPEEMPGVDLRIDASLAFLTEELGPYIREFPAPDEPPGIGHGYYRHNGMYPTVDGEVMYGMVRHFKPERVLEVGAGFSSLVISDALARNEQEGHPARWRRAFDPFPSARSNGARVDVQPVRAQDIPAAEFDALRASDVLVIDTTHTVKPDGDVTRLILDVLPRLQPGVVVHIHDFFRPYAYPRWFLADLGMYWQEQYLVQALLAGGDAFEVLIANYALVRAHPQEVATVIRGADGYAGDAPGSALWLRRKQRP